MKRHLTLLALALFPMLASCQAEKKAEKPADPAPAPAAETAEAASKVRFKTSKGEFVVELNAEKAPITVANFLDYVNKKHYDGTVFHRVMDGFMIQGGGIALSDGKLVEKPKGKGIKNESMNGLKNDRGTIAMARTPDPNSASAQFFINVVDNAMLNYPNGGGYTVFGKVIEGMDVVDQIKAVKTGNSVISLLHPVTGAKMDAPSENVPVEPVVITSAATE